MVKPSVIPAAVSGAARDEVTARPPAGDRHIAELRVRTSAGASPADLAAATRKALAAALRDRR